MKHKVAAVVLAVLTTALCLTPWTAVPVQAQAKTVRAAAASAARGTFTSQWFPVYNSTTFNAYLNVTAKSGGATSLDVKYQDSPDGVVAFDLPGASFTQVTGSTSTQVVISSRLPAAFVRMVATVAGSSTPTFTFSSHFMAVQQVGSQLVNSAILDADIGAGAAIAASKLAEDVARTASVTVATGAVLTLNGTPVTLVAAPGAGKVILIEEITAKLVFNSVAYTGSNALEFRYTNGSGAKVTADLSSAFLNSASGTNYATVKSVVTQVTPVANAAVVVFVPTANPAAGNSPLVFTIKYRVVTP